MVSIPESFTCIGDGKPPCTCTCTHNWSKSANLYLSIKIVTSANIGLLTVHGSYSCLNQWLADFTFCTAKLYKG